MSMGGSPAAASTHGWRQGPHNKMSCCRVIIEKYYQRLTLDFDTNKRICEEVAIIQSKRLRNKIAGFTTVSMGRRMGRQAAFHKWWRVVAAGGGDTC